MTLAVEHRADRPDLALFDFDGTLTVRELMPDFMRFAVPKHRLVIGYALLWPVIIGYKLGWTSGVTVRRAIVWFGFRGLTVEALDRLGRDYAATRIGPELRADMMARLEAHRQRGDRVVVVSGALDVYLKHWCDSLGLELVCSRLESVNGRMTGRYLGPQCVNDEKVARVRAVVAEAIHGRIHAYGDTKEDHAMLAMADVAWLRGVPVDRTVLHES